MKVNFRGGGHSLGVVTGASTHASQMKKNPSYWWRLPRPLYENTNPISRFPNRFVLCYSKKLMGM